MNETLMQAECDDCGEFFTLTMLQHKRNDGYDVCPKCLKEVYTASDNETDPVPAWEWHKANDGHDGYESAGHDSQYYYVYPAINLQGQERWFGLGFNEYDTDGLNYDANAVDVPGYGSWQAAAVACERWHEENIKEGKR